MVVVEQLHTLLQEGLPGFVQPSGQVAHSGFVPVVKPIHTGDNHILGPEALGLPGNLFRVPFQAAQVGVQADHF